MKRFRVRTLACGEAPSPVRMLAALPAGARPVLLDSSDGSSWSLLAWSPDPDSLHGRLHPLDRHPEALGGPDPGLLLTRACAEEVWEREDSAPPLAGGWLGFFGYECGHAWERFPWQPPDPAGFPDFHLARYRRVVAWEPTGRAHLLWAEAGNGDPRERREVEEDFRRLCRAPPLDPGSLAAVGPFPSPAPTLSAQEYRSRVERLRRDIGAGELFQANLSHRLEGPAPQRPRSLYARLRAAQPTAMGAYWEGVGGRALLSWSPELFLRVRGEELSTRPIKGTAPRPEDPLVAARVRAGLEASEKERAELTMIVDMARNDLGRIALPGSVRVASAGEVEAFPTLYHRTASVFARWNPTLGPGPLLAACFPPASVTGAPKVRALRAISELEDEARGPYCGSFCAWEPGEPRAAFSVLIRTATVAAGRLRLRVGAGIVWDSDPEREWRETLWKARFLHDDPSMASTSPR